MSFSRRSVYHRVFCRLMWCTFLLKAEFLAEHEEDDQQHVKLGGGATRRLVQHL